MANVFLQFLLDAEHGDLDAVRRNIEHGINLESRDEVRYRTIENYIKSFIFEYLGSTNSAYFSCSM
jgi:hypothetical protein